MDITGLLKEAIAALKRRRNLIVFFALAHIVFLFFGQWAVMKGIPAVVELRQELLKEIQTLAYLKPLTGALADSLALKILYTFLFNLLLGAFLSTTVTGMVIFFLPYAIAVWRSFTVGLLFYGLDSMGEKSVVFYGTFILEFAAYSISSAAGTDMGLSFLWPKRKAVLSRREAFSIAARDSVRLYIIVALLLFIGAVWEMGWLEIIGPLIDLTGAPS